MSSAMSGSSMPSADGAAWGGAFAWGLGNTLGLVVCALAHEGTTSRLLAPN